jgi:hypothetical protein
MTHKFLRVKAQEGSTQVCARVHFIKVTKLRRNNECKVPGRNPRSVKIPLFKNGWMRSACEKSNSPTIV